MSIPPGVTTGPTVRIPIGDGEIRLAACEWDKSSVVWEFRDVNGLNGWVVLPGGLDEAITQA